MWHRFEIPKTVFNHDKCVCTTCIYILEVKRD